MIDELKKTPEYKELISANPRSAEALGANAVLCGLPNSKVTPAEDKNKGRITVTDDQRHAAAAIIRSLCETIKTSDIRDRFSLPSEVYVHFIKSLTTQTREAKGGPRTRFLAPAWAVMRVIEFGGAR